jgi:hypothetical protein
MLSKNKSEVTFTVPSDPQKFYQDFGYLLHPKTNEPITKLTPYQYNIWKDGQIYKYRLTIKSQKVGLTTSSLLEDFQKSITTCRGKEILIIAQSIQHAKEHLYTLRKLIISSKKYSSFLINKPNELLFRDEVTKVTVLYIKNPDNPYKPTRIIALGPKEGSAWSWKEVKHIHMSDIAASNQIDDSGLFGAVFSRLANTDGTIHIETPPRGQRGKIWEIYSTSKLNDDDSQQFHVTEVPVSEAVKEGIITQEFLEGELKRQPLLYNQYYECEFLNPYNTWYDESLFQYDSSLQLGSDDSILV